MCHSSQERLRQQVQFLRRQFLQDGDLPFTNVLTEEVIAQALTAVTGWLELEPPLALSIPTLSDRRCPRGKTVAEGRSPTN